MSILEIEQLRKNYGRTKALENLSLVIEPGNVYGILGPNGSGKTTTLGIVLGVTRASGGRYRWFDGQSPHLARRRVGSLLETPNFYPYLSARGNFKVTAKIRGVSTDQIDAVLRAVGLSERAHDPFQQYSLGMKQRLAIAATLLGDPDVLIFDEPTNGIDARGIVEIRNLIIDIANRGKTIVLASHILDEVEKVCSHVAVLQKGRLVAAGHISEVLGGDKKILEVAAQDTAKLRASLAANRQVVDVTEAGSHLLASVTHDLDPADLNRNLYEQGIVVSHLAWRKQSLESKFLELTEGK